MDCFLHLLYMAAHIFNTVIIVNLSILCQLIHRPKTIFHDHDRNLIAVIDLVQNIAKTSCIDLPAPVGSFQIWIFQIVTSISGRFLSVLCHADTATGIIADSEKVHRTLLEDLFILLKNLQLDSVLLKVSRCKSRIISSYMNITGNVAYIYGDSTGGTGVVKFQEGMLDSMKNCDVEVIGEQWTTNWDPATAMGYAENWIAEYGDSLTAILCMNDGMAGGAIQALEGAGLAGKVLVCGQDCDLLACQRIVQGTQVSTVAKAGSEYPQLFTEACIQYYLGEKTAADFGTDVNSDGQTIPFMSYPGVVVTKDNIDETVIAAGLFTHEEVYGE